MGYPKKKRLKRSASFDVEEPMPVVRWTNEDDISSTELLPPELPGVHSSMYSSEEEETPICHHINNKTGRKKPISIEIPKILPVIDYDEILYDDFELTDKYLLYDDTFTGYNRYDMDEIDDDSHFLDHLNQEQLQLSEDDYEKIIEELEIETLHNNNEFPMLGRAETMFPHLPMSVVHKVYYHWLELRDTIGRPVLFSYALRKPVELPRRRRRSNKKRDLEKLTSLRLDLEKARVILDLIKKREKTKKELLLATEQIINTAMTSSGKTKEVPSKRSHYQNFLPPKKQKLEQYIQTETSHPETNKSKLQHTKTSPKRGNARQRRNSIEVMKIHNLLNSD